MFKFKCISSYCVDMGNKMFVKAIKEDGNVDLLIYGRHSDIDTLTLMEVEGKIKNENRSYLIVDSVNILDRFEDIRGSFSKLSVGMLFLEISYRANCCFEILIHCLNTLKKWETSLSLICFLYLFLEENGVFDKKGFTPMQMELLSKIRSKEIKLIKPSEKGVLTILKNKLLQQTQKYIGKELNSLKLLKGL